MISLNDDVNILSFSGVLSSKETYIASNIISIELLQIAYVKPSRRRVSLNDVGGRILQCFISTSRETVELKLKKKHDKYFDLMHTIELLNI